jgi:hypothetical protein
MGKLVKILGKLENTDGKLLEFGLRNFHFWESLSLPLQNIANFVDLLPSSLYFDEKLNGFCGLRHLKLTTNSKCWTATPNFFCLFWLQVLMNFFSLIAQKLRIYDSLSVKLISRCFPSIFLRCSSLRSWKSANLIAQQKVYQKISEFVYCQAIIKFYSTLGAFPLSLWERQSAVDLEKNFTNRMKNSNEIRMFFCLMWITMCRVRWSFSSTMNHFYCARSTVIFKIIILPLFLPQVNTSDIENASSQPNEHPFKVTDLNKNFSEVIEMVSS